MRVGRTSSGSASGAAIGLLIALAGWCYLDASPAGAKVRALTPAQADLVAPGSTGPIRERLIGDRARARTAAASTAKAYGGQYTVTVGGAKTRVWVYTSPNLKADRTVNLKWAQFFAGLPHGPELEKLRVYIAPIREIRSWSVCGPDADSCYDGNYNKMYLVSETPPDGASVTQIAAHEYGHHLALWRLNAPWDSLTWGPKRWASSARVCQYRNSGQMWPGDEGAHYEDNPAEIWAETYRVYATSVNRDPLDPWEIINPRWEPGSRELAAAAADTYRPWLKQARSSATGSLSTTGSQSQRTTVPVGLDGRVTAAVSTKGSLKVSLAAFAANGEKLATASRTTSFDACGTGNIAFEVTRLSGSGSWSLSIQSPGT